MEGNAMATLISNIQLVVTFIFTNIATALSTITESPLLIFTMGFLVVGGCVGLISRMLRK